MDRASARIRLDHKEAQPQRWAFHSYPPLESISQQGRGQTVDFGLQRARAVGAAQYIANTPDVGIKTCLVVNLRWLFPFELFDFVMVRRIVYLMIVLYDYLPQTPRDQQGKCLQ